MSGGREPRLRDAFGVRAASTRRLRSGIQLCGASEPSVSARLSLAFET